MATFPERRKPHQYRGCRIEPAFVPKGILTAVGQVNQYRRRVWRITFPDQTWILCGSLSSCRQYVNTFGTRYGVALG